MYFTALGFGNAIQGERGFANPVFQNKEIAEIYSYTGHDEEPVKMVLLNDKVDERIQELFILGDDWAGEPSFAPSVETLCNVQYLLTILPYSVIRTLDQDDITPTYHGTVSIDLEKGDDEISIEIGNDAFGYCGEIDGNTVILESTSLRNVRETLSGIIPHFKD